MSKNTSQSTVKNKSRKITSKKDKNLILLKKELQESQQSAKDNFDKLIRVQAEMENLRRRNAKDITNAHKFALEKFAEALLDVIDSMTRGIEASNTKNATIKSIREGMAMTHKIFLATLNKFSITIIDPQQEELNPEKHEAISMVSKPKLKSNTIVEVVQPGWQLNDRVLRPAMVIVTK